MAPPVDPVVNDATAPPVIKAVDDSSDDERGPVLLVLEKEKVRFKLHIILCHGFLFQSNFAREDDDSWSCIFKESRRRRLEFGKKYKKPKKRQTRRKPD